MATERSAPSTIDNNEPIHYAYIPGRIIGLLLFEISFSLGRLPRVRQMWYCLCDIEIAEAQELIEQQPPQSVVTDTHGWMSSVGFILNNHFKC